jgi:hypothetical protein
MVDGVKEPTDVRVEHPVHPPALNPGHERVQRVMRRAPRSEPIREAKEVHLVDGVQDLDHRPLDDFVLQRGDPERPLPPVDLRDVRPSRRLRSIRAPVDTSVKIPKVLLQIPPVVPPRHTVHPRRGVRADRPVRRPQAIDGHVMKERREPCIVVLPRHLAHAAKLTRHAHSGTASGARFAGHVSLGRPPSLHHLRDRRGGLVRQLRRYYGAVRLPMTVHQGITAKRRSPHGLPRPSTGQATMGPPGSRAWRSRACPGSSTAQAHQQLAIAPPAVLPSTNTRVSAPRT